MAGQQVVINYDISPVPTLFYVFKPSCGWCKKNEGNINALAKQSEGKVRVIALSLSSEQLSEYIRNWGPELPVYADPTPATIAVYRLGGTPNTVLIAPDGKVLKVWTGAYTGETQRQIEDYFKVALPGLSKPG